MSIPSTQLNNGVTMPMLGLGLYLMPEHETARNVTLALENGYRLLDTAAAYNNEKGVGEGIRQSRIPREEIFVTTKLWNSNHGYENALKGFETSLDKLGLDYVDLYLMHWPCPKKGLTIETWEAIEHLYRDGRVRAIGVCNFTVTHLDKLLAQTKVAPAVLQIEIHPTFTQEKIRDFAQDRDIQVESWYPLGGKKSIETLLKTPVLVDLAKKYGKTPAQIVLRWHTQLGLVVIPKSSHPERIKENCAIFDFEMAQQELALISSLDKGTRLGPDPDTFE